MVLVSTILIFGKKQKIRIKDKSENFLGKNPIFKAMGNGHKKY